MTYSYKRYFENDVLDVKRDGDRLYLNYNQKFECIILRKRKMKIAIVTNDGTTISQHFGRAPFYLVVTVEEGKIAARERCDKLGHAQFQSEPHSEVNDARGHGFGAESQSRHARMAGAIADCQVLLAGGMGAGAYESMKDAGIQPIVTDIGVIDDAVHAYLEGRLIDHTERLD